MMRYPVLLAGTMALFLLGWGVYLAEDGMLNPGAVDVKETTIGTLFMLAALILLAQVLRRGSVRRRIAFPVLLSFLSLPLLLYMASIYMRWQDHEYRFVPPRGSGTVIGHVDASGEWLVIDRVLLERPAHWYETGVRLTYLAGDRQPRTIQLPAKYLPLKSIYKKAGRPE